MHRTLFTIPHDIGGVPIFGFGIVFAVLALGGVAYLFWGLKRGEATQSLFQQAVIWLLFMGAVAIVVPRIELHDHGGRPLGVAVRGYGACLLAAVMCSVLLAVYRSKKTGLREDIVFMLAPWLVVGGIIGARLFYVAVYPEQFFRGTPAQIIVSILSFTSGGMVVYGSMIGGLIAGAIFCFKNHFSFLRLGDLVVPSLFLGVALGRFGCLLNGCCWGGRCEESWSALHFPQGSPVYEDQLVRGELVGLQFDPESIERKTGELHGTLTGVVPGSLADKAGFEAKEKVVVEPELPAQIPPGTPRDDFSMLGLRVTSDRHSAKWDAKALPPRALPVTPAQIISSLGGAVLCVGLIIIAPWVQHRHGLLLSIGFSAYAIIRYFEEIVRVDEPGRFGTSLTIAQWVSVTSLVFFCGLIAWILTRPKERFATDADRNNASG